MTSLINSMSSSKTKDSKNSNMNSKTNNDNSRNNGSHSSTKSHNKYKVVLLGESGTGKSSLAQRLIKNEWSANLNSTVGASFFRWTCSVNDTTVNCDIWDTAGQERYRSLASMYYRGAAAALVVYDITSHESFDRAKHWVQELNTNSPDTVIAIAGNKKDLEATRSVSEKEAQIFAQEKNLLYMETSAKEGVGVREVFVQLVTKLVENNNAINVRPGGILSRNAVTETSPAETTPQQKRSMCC